MMRGCVLCLLLLPKNVTRGTSFSQKVQLGEKSAPSTPIHPPSVCVVLSILQIDVVIANKSKHQPFDKALKD